MIGTSPHSKHVLCCLDGVWCLIAYPHPGAAIPASSLRSRRETDEHIAALETANQALRLEAKRSAERAQFQLAEVEHRLKNTFATIQALARQSARRDDTAEAFRTAFCARLAALARSHEMLGPNCPDGAPLADIVASCLRPYDDALGRTTVTGPAVHLPARNLSALGLTFHELATNATKHGALSVPQGRVEVTWRMEPGMQGQQRSVAILWRERGGPVVKAPDHRGFGLRLLERGVGQGASGTTQLDFAPQGVDCHIRLLLPAAPGEAARDGGPTASLPSGGKARGQPGQGCDQPPDGRHRAEDGDSQRPRPGKASSTG